jgi:hypothetical protein
MSGQFSSFANRTSGAAGSVAEESAQVTLAKAPTRHASPSTTCAPKKTARVVHPVVETAEFDVRAIS